MLLSLYALQGYGRSAVVETGIAPPDRDREAALESELKFTGSNWPRTNER